MNPKEVLERAFIDKCYECDNLKSDLSRIKEHINAIYKILGDLK